MRMNQKIISATPGAALVAIGLMLFAGGCSSASIPAWQTSVAKYVQTHDNDPTVLRDVTLADHRIGFGLLGGDDPKHSTDAEGLLLGHKEITGRLWFIYLVGLDDNNDVKDIRLAALRFENGKPTWVVQHPDSKALKTYRNFNEGLWKADHDKKVRAPADFTRFPRDADQFDLAIDGTIVTATHEASRARWQIDLRKK